MVTSPKGKSLPAAFTAGLLVLAGCGDDDSSSSDDTTSEETAAPADESESAAEEESDESEAPAEEESDDTDDHWEQTTVDWYLGDGGLPVEVVGTKESLSSTFVGDVHYEEQYHLLLRSLTPLR